MRAPYKSRVRGLSRYVYAAYSAKTDEVKIGSSFFPAARLRELTNEAGHPATLLAQVLGNERKEYWYHRRLSAFRSRKYSAEWFRRCPEVLLVVSEMMLIQRAHEVFGEAA